MWGGGGGMWGDLFNFHAPLQTQEGWGLTQKYGVGHSAPGGGGGG